MTSYRPICDVWLLARPKVKYPGAYPSGFLMRARALLGVGPDDPVLHVCAGKVRDGLYTSLEWGLNDATMDLDPELKPDYLHDARELPYPKCPDRADGLWAAVLADPPYTDEDADRYRPGRACRPSAETILRNSLTAVPIGGRVGILHYVWPRPPEHAQEVAVVAVGTGRNNRARWFTVFVRTR